MTANKLQRLHLNVETLRVLSSTEMPWVVGADDTASSLAAGGVCDTSIVNTGRKTKNGSNQPPC